MLNLVEIYEKYDYLIALIVSSSMWLFGFFTKRFTKEIKKMKIRKVLQLKKDAVLILIPDRHGKLILSSEEGATEITDNFVTKSEMEAAFELKEEMNNLGLLANILNRPTKEKCNNIFCIGGPLSNINTARYFRKKSLFLPLTFGVHKDSQYLSKRNRKKLADIAHEDGYDENGHLQGSIRLDGKTVYTFNREKEGYVFLAKLTSKADFNNSKKEVVHICFGNNSTSTFSAVKCYFEYYDDLNKYIKNKNHYCIVIGCDKEGNLDFSDVHDFTHDFLKENV